MTIGIENTAHNDNTTLAGASSTTIATFTITNANALCVTISFLTLGGLTPTGVTVTWDSGGTNQAMTQVAHATASGLDAYIFGLLAPTTGARTLSVTWTNNANFGIGVIGLTGVTQASLAAAFVNTTTNTGTGTTASVTIPTSANSGVIGIAVDKDPASSASGVSNTVLLLGNGVIANNAGDFVSNYQISSGSTSVTLSYTLGSATWAYAGINVLAPVKLEWGFEQSNQFQSPYSIVRNTHRSSGIKGKSGFALFKDPFRQGWEIQPPQPPFQTTVKQRLAALSHPEEGIEREYNNFHPSGWEVQPPQPPASPQAKQRGSILRGIDGIEGQFSRFLPAGWEIQPPQPPVYPTNIQKASAALSHPEEGIEGLYINIPVGWWVQPWQPPVQPTTKQKYPGTKGKTTAIIYSNWVNGGWEIQSVQPPFFPKTSQKIGALSRWEDGSEIPFVFVSPTPTVWAFDFQQPPLKINYRSGSWSQREEGIEFPLVNFSPSGWEIQPPPPPHTFIEKRGAVLRGIDGIEGPLVNFFPAGWEIQSYQPPFLPKINQKTGAFSHPEEGIEAKYVFVSTTPTIWGYDIQYTASKINYRSGSWSQKTEGIDVPYINFPPLGWEIQPFQPPVQPVVKQRAVEALSHPEEGIEVKFQVVALLNWGFELQSGWQPPNWLRTNQKIGATSQWEDGIEGVYVFIAPPQPIWGYDIQSFQPISVPTNRKKYPGVKGKLLFSVFKSWINSGWEIQPWQPPAFPRVNNKAGAWSQWEDGIEGVYVFVAPAPPIWGYDIQPTVSRISYRSGSWSQKTEGIDAPYINFHSYGWELQPPQPPTSPKTNIKIGAMSQWEDGIEAKYVFVAPPSVVWGYDIQPLQPPFLPKTNQKIGALSRWEDGIEAPLVAPFINFVAAGWEIQPPQSQFYPTVYQRGSGTKGKAEFAAYSIWANGGWEIQSVQPPYNLTANKKYGALSHPEEGIEAQFVFVPPSLISWGWEPPIHLKQVTSNRYTGIEGTNNFASFTFQPYGWEIQAYQPVFLPKTNQKTSALAHPEEGIENKYVFVPPVVPIVNIDFQQSLSKVNYRGSAWSQGERGNEFQFISFKPYGWEVQPLQPPVFPKTNQKIGALSQWEDGIEGIYVFIAPASIVWSFDFQQPPLKINYRSGSWSQKTEGIDAPYISFNPYGWEIQPPQPPIPIKVNIKYGALSHPEEGIEGKFVFVAPPPIIWSFDFQQPPLKINYRSGSWSQREEGIEFPLVNFSPSGWEIQPPQPPFFLKISQKTGALSHPEEGIEGTFVPPPSAILNWGFEFQTLWQPPNFPRTNQRGPAIKGRSEFAVYSPWINGGWEIQSVQPPNFIRINQKYGALSAQDRLEARFIFVPPAPITWGWELPPSYLRQVTSNRYSGIEGTSDFASFTFQPYGWEIQSVQPPNSLRTNQKQGALSQWEDGSEIKFTFVAPPPLIWGYDIQPVISKITYRSGAWSQREEGIELSLINFFPSGWEIQPPQPPHPKPEVKAAAILRGIDSIESPFIKPFPNGWEIQPPQPPFFLKISQKTGALSHPEEGIEGLYVFIAPPFFTDSWEIQAFQPPHTFFEKKGAILRGIDSIESPLVRPFPNGWEIQPPQPPFWLRTSQKIGGATSHREDGIEGVYVFVAPPPISRGWDPTLPLVPRWIKLNQLWGALSKWEDGIEGLYKFVPPIIPPIPPPVLGPISNLNYRDMHTLGLSPSSNLYWDYGNTEDFYVLQNATNTLHRVSPRFAFNWYGTTPNALTIYNPFLTTILSGGTIHFSDDSD